MSLLRPVAAALLALTLPAFGASGDPRPIPGFDHPEETPTRAAHAMVVTIQHDATDAGVSILQSGGNAVDAAVAVGFALAVTYPQAGNLGGGGFMLLRMHALNRGHHGPFRTHFLDYRETAPAAATRDMYLDAKGNVVPELSTVGYKASGVPGTVAGLVYAQAHFGRLSLAQDMAPAIRLAADGYTLSAEEAANLHNDTLARFPPSAHKFQRDGNFYTAGERFAQPALAQTLRAIAANPTTFYRGAMASTIAAAMQAGGGILTVDDLAHYQVKERRPIRGTYHGYQILSAPPPSSGGTVLVEILNILSRFNLHKLKRAGQPEGDRSVAQVHLITESFRRAYMDRADFLGDPDFNKIPVGKLDSPRYARAWAEGIDPILPTPSNELVRPTGFLPSPPAANAPKDHPDTTHFSIVDADGNAVSNTYTLNNTFGSAVTIAPLGFLMNDEMDDFSSKAGVPNMYGLIQGPANAIGPGHRPLSAMTPTIVLGRHSLFHPHRNLRMVLGTPGGSTIITTVANTIVSTLDNGLNIQQAADAPRFHHQYLPDRLDLEKTFPEATAEHLQDFGYRTNRQMAADEHSPGTWGDCELIEVDPRTHQLLGGHDSRRPYGKAAGY